MTAKSPQAQEIVEEATTSKIHQSEPVVETHVLHISKSYLQSQKPHSLGTKPNLHFFQTQSRAIKIAEDQYQYMLPFFKDHAMPKHLRCFK